MQLAVPMKLIPRDPAQAFGLSAAQGSAAFICALTPYACDLDGPVALVPESMSHMGNKDEDVSAITLLLRYLCSLLPSSLKCLVCNGDAYQAVYGHTLTWVRHSGLSSPHASDPHYVHPRGYQSIETPGL